ncbi:hypothetical protein E3P92_01543 [Wallemia ichthyophaga]|nr:hypothetical protein E3P97_01782 [Wallemia ichthyophaga]TIA95072.1 hypothetical protein E3P96_03929 [Wallemia ichthyophaga]TIB00967.1 hypothetical protein E3P95_01496 [Wallemia ichthyophaga]TIB01919.1 hypothetical protein E3P94_01628 [Wallemia ichthyophaga]TIB15843.1 hypothetical protein E3P92_01543 [Wallemia ichthyophaga]
MAIKLLQAINHTDKLGWPLCNHDKRVLLLRANTQRHPQELFYRCSIGDSDNCQYFFWLADFEKCVDSHLDEVQSTTNRRHIIQACIMANDQYNKGSWSTNTNDDVLAEFDIPSGGGSIVDGGQRTNKREHQSEWDIPATPTKCLNSQSTSQPQLQPQPPKKARKTHQSRHLRHSPNPSNSSDFFDAINTPTKPTKPAQPTRRRNSSEEILVDHFSKQVNEIASLHNTIASLRDELAEVKALLKRERKVNEVEQTELSGMLYKAYKKIHHEPPKYSSDQVMTGRPHKQSMSELKLRRLNEHNQRLKDDYARPRINVSEASQGLIRFCNSTKDYLIPSVWGPVDKKEDPYAPQGGGCCVVV